MNNVVKHESKPIVPIKTQAMIDREQSRAGVEWNHVGNNYFVGLGHGPMGIRLVYIALPPNHPCINDHYDKHQDLEVNGGLTFGEGNVFGWDYGHAYNDHNYTADFDNALTYFKALE
jgi:hypothetical protein